MPRGYTAKPGRFEPFPFQLEPLDLVVDGRFNSMTLCWASQVLGKTEIINCLLGYAIECGEGGGMMVIQPTLAMAAGWSKLKLAPLLKDLEREIKDQPFTSKGARAESTVALKVWDNGFLVCGGANSAAGLSMFSCRFLFADEVDRYPPSVATRGNAEGDPIAIAERRTESFHDAWIVHTSTPTTRGVSRIEAELAETDARKWHVRCTKCKREWVIMWADIRWQKDKLGGHQPETAWLECPHCHAHHSDEARRTMVKAGRWLATNPKVKDKPGFHANAFITLLKHKRKYRNRLHQWSSEWLEAKRKGPEMVRAFINQVLTESYEEPAEKPTAPEILAGRREHYFEGERPKLPEGVLILTVGADKQIDRVEAELVGWGLDEESWSIEYRVFPGDFESKRFRELVGAWLSEKYEMANGSILEVAAACFDSGDRPESVYKFCKELAPKAVYAVKGYGSMDLPWINRSKTVGRLVNLNVDAAKATIFSRLTITEPGPGYFHFPFNRDLEWFRQLTSERLVTYIRQGIKYKRFELFGGGRNEALDARVYAYAGLGLLGRINWKGVAARLGVSLPAKEEPEADRARTPPAAPQATSAPASLQRARSVWNIRGRF